MKKLMLMIQHFVVFCAYEYVLENTELVILASVFSGWYFRGLFNC